MLFTLRGNKEVESCAAPPYKPTNTKLAPLAMTPKANSTVAGAPTKSMTAFGPPLVSEINSSRAEGSELSRMTSAPASRAAARLAGSISATMILALTTALAIPIPARPTPPAPTIRSDSSERRCLTFFKAL